MATFTVEEGFATPGSFTMSGRSVVTIKELPGTGPWPETLTDNKLIQTDQSVDFGFSWAVSGALLPILAPGCSWRLQLSFERWGAQEFNAPANASVPFGSAVVSGPAVTPTYTYHHKITIGPNTVPEGVYDIVAVLRMYSPTGAPLPVAGFAEFGKVEFYKSA
jgi:hypothetical protein